MAENRNKYENFKATDLDLNNFNISSFNNKTEKVQINIHSEQKESYSLAFPRLKPVDDLGLIWNEEENALIWGAVGAEGEKGEPGIDGVDGENGKSYLSTTDNEFTTTEIQDAITNETTMVIQCNVNDTLGYSLNQDVIISYSEFEHFVKGKVLQFVEISGENKVNQIEYVPYYISNPTNITDWTGTKIVNLCARDGIDYSENVGPKGEDGEDGIDGKTYLTYTQTPLTATEIIDAIENETRLLIQCDVNQNLGYSAHNDIIITIDDETVIYAEVYDFSDVNNLMYFTPYYFENPNSIEEMNETKMVNLQGKKGEDGDRYYTFTDDLTNLPDLDNIIDETISFIVEPNLAWSNGLYCYITNPVEVDGIPDFATPPTNSFIFQVEEYNSISGEMTCKYIWKQNNVIPIGKCYVNLTGMPGENGGDGEDGADGDKYKTVLKDDIAYTINSFGSVSFKIEKDLAWTRNMTAIFDNKIDTTVIIQISSYDKSSGNMSGTVIEIKELGNGIFPPNTSTFNLSGVSGNQGPAGRDALYYTTSTQSQFVPYIGSNLVNFKGNSKGLSWSVGQIAIISDKFTPFTRYINLQLTNYTENDNNSFFSGKVVSAKGIGQTSSNWNINIGAKDGEDGMGFKDAYINASFHLILVKDDNTVIDVGYVKGDKGDDGNDGVCNCNCKCDDPDTPDSVETPDIGGPDSGGPGGGPDSVGGSVGGSVGDSVSGLLPPPIDTPDNNFYYTGCLIPNSDLTIDGHMILSELIASSTTTNGYPQEVFVWNNSQVVEIPYMAFPADFGSLKYFSMNGFSSSPPFSGSTTVNGILYNYYRVSGSFAADETQRCYNFITE